MKIMRWQEKWGMLNACLLIVYKISTLSIPGKTTFRKYSGKINIQPRVHT